MRGSWAAALCTLTASSSAQTTLPHTYGFEDAAVVAGTVCDNTYDTLHELPVNPGEPIVKMASHFTTYYSDTLCADGSGGLHSCAGSGASKTGGAKLGVVNNNSPRVGPGGTNYGSLQAAEGNQFYQIMASGVDGFTFVCFEPATFTSPTNVRASLQIYNAQAGWHEEPDRLRVWAETATGSVSMLPVDTDGSCVTEVDKHNIDRLGLRDSATGSEWTGANNAPGDPAILPDQYQWRTLSAELGAITTAKVCAGLQTGAGHELLWIDNLTLASSATATSVCYPLQTLVSRFVATVCRLTFLFYAELPVCHSRLC